METLTITSKDKMISSWMIMILGLIMTSGGLFGVWLQGEFYHGGFPIAATFGELYTAFTLPTAITVLGCLIVSGALFASPITHSWTMGRRIVAFSCFGAFVLIVCGICAYFATSRVANILE